MEKMSLKNELQAISYPGKRNHYRKSADGKHAITAYLLWAEVRTAETVFLLRMERESARRLLILPN